MRRTLASTLVLALGIALGAGISLWLREEPRAASLAPLSATDEVPVVAELQTPVESEIRGDALEELADLLVEFEQATAEDEAADSPPPLRRPIAFPVEEKYAGEGWSDVPHDLLGAWDNQRRSSAIGDHRAFVLVVSPELSDAELVMLARDVRSAHLDAANLDVRVYDSREAARAGGSDARLHRVIEVARNEHLKLDVIRLRGRVVSP